jgi:glucokinase
VPHLDGADLAALGGGHAVAGEPVAVIAPGTGLGIACYVPAGDHAHVLATEGGHATWAPEDAEEEAVMHVLRRRFGHVSIERVVSGSGMVVVHEALCELAGLPAPTLSAGEITAAARVSDPNGAAVMARRTIDMFCAVLGSAAGNLALTFGARGGVLIGGGIPPRLLDELRRSAFRARFESKGRMGSYTRPIPTRVILRADPTFVGLAALARRSGARAP